MTTYLSPQSLWRGARDLAVYLLLRAALGAAAFLPPPAAGAAARIAGALAFALCRRRRRIALRNLEIAFRGALDPASAGRTARAAFQNAAAVVLGLARRERWVRRDDLERLFEVPEAAAAILESALGEAGRGEPRRPLAILSSHVGDWEMVHHYLALRGIPVQVVTRPLSNRRLDLALARLRCRHGAGVIPKRGALRRLRHELERGAAVGLLADQNCPHRRRFFPFFGVPASTYTEYARLFTGAGCRVLFIACVRRGPGDCFRLVVEDLADGTSDPTATAPRAARRRRADELVQRYLQATERLARAHPEQYLWLHRRWKSRPDGSPWLYHGLGKVLDPALLS